MRSPAGRATGPKLSAARNGSMALLLLAAAVSVRAAAPSTQLVSKGFDGGAPLTGATSAAPAISADGRYVAFMSDVTNVVQDDTNNKSDVFVWDRLTGLSERVS